MDSAPTYVAAIFLAPRFPYLNRTCTYVKKEQVSNPTLEGIEEVEQVDTGPKLVERKKAHDS